MSECKHERWKVVLVKCKCLECGKEFGRGTSEDMVRENERRMVVSGYRAGFQEGYTKGVDEGKQINEAATSGTIPIPENPADVPTQEATT